MSKHIGGKLKSIWGSFNADLPDNITALAMSGEALPIITINQGTVNNMNRQVTGTYTLPSITINQGNVNKMNRHVTGTYNGKSFELDTLEGLTLIYLNGKLVDDDDEVYDEILNAVIDQGYTIEDRSLKGYNMNFN